MLWAGGLGFLCDFWGAPVLEVLWSPRCSGPQCPWVPKVLQSLLEEAAEIRGVAGTIPVLGFSPALRFPPQ